MTDIYKVSNYTGCQIGLVKGEQGIRGADGIDGLNGLNGVNGINGKSAYQLAVEAGFIGTVDDYRLSLKGEKGEKGDAGIDGEGVTTLIQEAVGNVVTGAQAQIDAAIEGVAIDANLITDALVSTTGGISQLSYNNGVASVADLPSNIKVFSGMRVFAKGSRGGEFVYDASKKLVNDGGAVINGWVRQYTGAVYLDWFCTGNPATTDCSTALEKAFKVSRSVKCGSGSYKFTGRVGLPVQPITSPRKLKLRGDGDTVFDMSTYDLPHGCITSETGKANPTSTENLYTAVIDIQGINFLGSDAKTAYVIDGDRIYNLYASYNSFHKLKAVIKSNVSLPESQGGIPYTQTIFMTHNNISQNENIIDANELINIVFDYNQCEANTNGIYCQSLRPDGTAIAVGRFNFNLFEGGGQFLYADGDVHALTLIGNYFEYNIYGRVVNQLCQINITGQCLGFVEMGNSYGGQSDALLQGGYMDIRIDGTIYNDGLQRGMPVSIANVSNALKHNSTGKMLAFGNAALSTTPTHLGGNNQTQIFETRNMRSAQESGVSSYGARLAYYTSAYVNQSGSLLIGIVDASSISSVFKNKMSMCSYDVQMNFDMINSGITIGMASIAMKLTLFAPTLGVLDANMPSTLHMTGKLIDLQQAKSWNIDTTDPTSIIAEQFGANAALTVTPIAGNKFELRITNYLQATVVPVGYPNLFVNSVTCTAYTRNRDSNAVVGANLRFIDP